MEATDSQAPAAAAASATSQKYHAMFPDIAPLSSQQLIQDTLHNTNNRDTTPQWQVAGHKALLVDVRSEPERNVSMISGAISLHEFKKEVLPNLFEENDITLVALYCTIGYRSGMEGQKLLHNYPSLFQCDNVTQDDETNTLNHHRQSKVQLRNMDGIVNFANALGSGAVAEQSSLDLNALLVNHPTKQPATKVHVYGPTWKQYLDDKYDPVVFSNVEFACRGLGVLFRSIRCPSCFRCCSQAN